MTALARVSDDLLLAAQSGDRHALTQLLVALQPDIRRYARRLCHRTSVIEDVVQEALIVVYRRVGTIRSPAALAGWLVTEIGRQPWLVTGILRTAGASRIMMSA